MAARLKKTAAQIDTSILKVLWMVLDALALIPFFTLILGALFQILPAFLQNICDILLDGLLFILVWLHSYCILYIAAALLLAASIIAFIQDSRGKQLRRKEIPLFLVLVLFCALGLFVTEIMYTSMMRI